MIATNAVIDDRGSGRLVATRLYRVVVGGYETDYAPTGEPLGQQFIHHAFALDVPSGGPFGWGEQRWIDVYVAHHLPSFTVVEATPYRFDPTAPF